MDNDIQNIIMDIVDYLQPGLSPYESVIYWFMFRHSIVSNGERLTRVSVTKLSKGIGSKFKNEGKPVRASDKSISDNLRTLEGIGAIKKVGDTTREGTLYKVFLPREIECCKQRIEQSSADKTPIVNHEKEQDFYNVKENRLKIFERDKYLCYKCQKQLTIHSATLDHVQPVSKGGDNSYENLVTCCLHHNSTRGAKPISDFLLKK